MWSLLQVDRRLLWTRQTCDSSLARVSGALQVDSGLQGFQEQMPMLRTKRDKLVPVTLWRHP